MAHTPTPAVAKLAVPMIPPVPWKTGYPFAKDSYVTLESVTFKSKIDNNLATPSTSSEDWTVVQ